MGSSRYEIRIRGRLGEKVAKRFEGFDMEVEPVETVLRGPVQDQAALHGVLERIESLGLELLEVRRVEDAGPEH
jgi:lactate dehydrogenase-like 2-hydroxyacid dehydrogenase